jgi:sulfur-carrier protein
MQANLYATFRLLAGEKSIILTPIDGWTVMQVVDEIVRQNPVLRKHWINDAGELHAHVHIFLNGNDVMTLPGKLSAPVSPSDTLDFFPPVAGG